MAYINTNSIKVFPSAFRTAPANGKYTSEENFINILNSIVDYPTDADGYIVKSDGNEWAIVIHGYLFTFELNKSNYQNAWARIRVEQGLGDAAANALVNFGDASINMDVSGTFRGLEIVDREPTKEENVYILKIIENGNICSRNYAKFRVNSILYDNTNNSNLKDKLDDIDKTDANIKNLLNKLNGTTSSTNPDEYNEKQNKLKTGSYTALTDNSDGTTTISVDQNAKTILDSLNKTVGSAINPIYIDKKEAKASTATVGKKFTQNAANGESQNVYLKDGTITAGNSIFIRTTSPTNADNTGTGVDGDIWFKYQA